MQIHKTSLKSLFVCLILLCSQCLFSQDDRGEETITFDFACAKIISTTEAKYPASTRNREKLGVGEVVTLELKPAKGIVDWEIVSGEASFKQSGDVKKVNAEKPMLWIREKSGIVKVIANVPDCNGIPKIMFEVVVPTDIRFTCLANRGFHKIGHPSAGTKALEMYVYPDDVSFYNLEFQEGFCTATGTSTYWQDHNLGHSVGPWTPCADAPILDEYGTPTVGFYDFVSIEGKLLFTPNSGQDGTTEFAIPVAFKIKQTGKFVATNVTNEQVSTTNNAGTTQIKKEDIATIPFKMNYPLTDPKYGCKIGCWFPCEDCCLDLE